jgi:hypothetical protein
MSFKEWKINFSSNDIIERDLVENIIELIKTFYVDIAQTFRLRNVPEHIFDNIIGKYISYILLKNGFKSNSLTYNSYWLENVNFLKELTDNNIKLRDMGEIIVEYWFKYNLDDKTSYQYHIDTNIDIDNNKISPIFTSVIYLNESTIPTVILDQESKSLSLCFPEYLKSITFDGKKLHGTYKELYKNNTERVIIGINVYNKEIKYLPYLDVIQMYQWSYILNRKNPKEIGKDIDLTVKKKDTDSIIKLEINSTNVQYENFIQSLLENNVKSSDYKKYKQRILSEITNYVNANSRAFNIKINTDISDWVLYDTKKYNDDYDSDYDSDNNNTSSKVKTNFYDVKYKNVFLEKSILSRDSCEWLINETNARVKEIYGEWKNDRHSRYPTYDIAIDKLNLPVMNFILNLFMKNIGNLIFNRFNISNDYNLNISDAFIVKYEENKQRSLEFHSDDADISVILLLSNENAFTGGGTQFENGLSVFPNQGDMLIFGSKYKHQGLEITSGIRMILTFFVNIKPN